MHPSKDEFRHKHQEAYMDEPGKTQTQKRSLQRMEARKGNMGGMLRSCLSSQGSARKAKALVELNLARDAKESF